MRRTVVTVFILLFTMAGGSVDRSSAAGTEGQRPAVIKTLPVAGDTSVDPSVNEIRVTFSKVMKTDRMWSWVKEADESFPKVTGEPRYLDDQRTCILPVQLRPGHAYEIWINSAKFNGFRDSDNHPAVPYLLEFQTKK